MSERKVLSKWYPPDFDPSKIARVKGSKASGPKLQTVRLMAPFSMKCTACGEYIYKGRKFNARKETTDEKYLAIPIYRFYIKCTRCSAEITFRTDPKNMDYECEKGARRNFEVWREAKLAEETDEERLDRLEKEEAERDAMKDLEKKTLDAKTEMGIADALDEIRMRNARNERAGNGMADIELAEAVDEDEERRKREEVEDREAARLAFANAKAPLNENGDRVRRVDFPPEQPLLVDFSQPRKAPKRLNPEQQREANCKKLGIKYTPPPKPAAAPNTTIDQSSKNKPSGPVTDQSSRPKTKLALVSYADDDSEDDE